MGTFSTIRYCMSAYLVESPMQLDSCPLCLKKGRHSSLTFFRMSLKESALLCSNMRCPFPLGTNYDDVFIEHDVSESEDDISEGSGSDEDIILKTFPLLSSQVSDLRHSSHKDTENEDEAVQAPVPSMNLRLPDIDSTSHSGSSISQEKPFSCNTPTDELHQMLKASDGLEFDDIESIYLSTNNSVLSEEGFEEFDSMLSDMEFQESIKLKDNKSPSFKMPLSKNCVISENHVSSSVSDHVNSEHSSFSKDFYSPSSQLSHIQDVKKTLPQVSPIEKIEVWMTNVPDPKSDSPTGCKKLIAKLQSAGNNSATIMCTKHSSDLFPNNDSCPLTSNIQECSCDNNSSEKCQESLDTSYSMHREDDSIIKLNETDIQHSRCDDISDLCPTSDNGQELSRDQSSERCKIITHLNTECQSGDENTSDIATLVENDRPENNSYTSAHHVSNVTLGALSSTTSHSSNDHQSSEKHLESYECSSPSRSAENENVPYVHMLYENDKRDNLSSTYRSDLLQSGTHSSTTDNKESSSGQQYCERLPKTFDTVSTSASSRNVYLSDAGPSVLCAKANNKSSTYGEEHAPFDVTSYPSSKLTNGTTDCFSPSSSESTAMCCDPVYNSSRENIKPSAYNEIQCIYSETSNEILDVCNLLPQQEEHMSDTPSSSRILNTVIIECTENIPLPSANDLGANVVEFSMVKRDSENKEVYCAYKMVKYDSQCASCIQDDHPFSSILECGNCRTISTEQSRCMCCEHCRTLSTEQSICKYCGTRVYNYNEEKDIPSMSLWPPPANLTDNNYCMDYDFFQCEEGSLAEVRPSPCINIPPVSSGIERTASSQMEKITLKELPHIQEPIVFQETNSTENSNSTDHCVSQQATVNNRNEAEMKPKKAQKSKTYRSKKRKNNRSCRSQQNVNITNKPRFNKQDVIAKVVRLDVSYFNGDVELTLF